MFEGVCKGSTVQRRVPNSNNLLVDVHILRICFPPACRRRCRRQQRDAAAGHCRHRQLCCRHQVRQQPASALVAAVAAIDCGWHFVRGFGLRLSIVTQGTYSNE